MHKPVEKAGKVSRAEDAGKMSREGGCVCGEVRYCLVGQPLRVGLCHCADCRKYSGSPFTHFAVWPRNQFSASGHFATYRGRSFCTGCGSRVFSLRSDEAEIMAGSLDEAPTDLIPTYEVWVTRREGWLPDLPWADQFSGDREVGVQNWRQALRAG